MLGHRLEKANKIARKRYIKWYGFDPLIKQDKRYPCMGTLRKNNVICSSPFCCGNERRIKGETHLTRQELINIEANPI